MQVLIVDDEQDSSEFVARYLQHEGFHTETVPNGRDALEVLVQCSQRDLGAGHASTGERHQVVDLARNLQVPLLGDFLGAAG